MGQRIQTHSMASRLPFSLQVLNICLMGCEHANISGKGCVVSFELKPQSDKTDLKISVRGFLSSLLHLGAGSMAAMAAQPNLSVNLISQAISNAIDSVNLNRLPEGVFFDLLSVTSEIAIAELCRELHRQDAEPAMVQAYLDHLAPMTGEKLKERLDIDYESEDPYTLIAQPFETQLFGWYKEALNLHNPLGFDPCTSFWVAALRVAQEFSDKIQSLIDQPPAMRKISDARLALANHIRWIETSHYAPLFSGASDGGFDFCADDIFVEVPMYRPVTPGESPLENLNDKECDRFTALILDLVKEQPTMSVAGVANQDEAWITLRGGPGSGKSTQMRRTALQLSRQLARYSAAVLYLPLQDVVVDVDTKEILVSKRILRSQKVFETLDAAQVSKKVLFLDGVDELGGGSSAAAQVKALCHLLRDRQKLDEDLYIVMAGRDSAMQTYLGLGYESEYRQLRMWHLCKPPKLRPDEVPDLFVDAPDLSVKLWARLCQSSQGTPNYLVSEAFLQPENPLAEIRPEPLLLVLAFRLALRQSAKPEADQPLSEVLFKTKGELFEELFRYVQIPDHRPRDPTGPFAYVEELEFDRYLDLIGCLALAANRAAGGRTGNLADAIDIARSLDMETAFRKALQIEGMSNDLAPGDTVKMMSVFYYQRTSCGDPANIQYEFTHKSFGDYLCARSILRAFGEAFKDYGKRDFSDKAWICTVFGTTFSSDIYDWMLQIAPNLVKPVSSDSLFYDPAEKFLKRILNGELENALSVASSVRSVLNSEVACRLHAMAAFSDNQCLQQTGVEKDEQGSRLVEDYAGESLWFQKAEALISEIVDCDLPAELISNRNIGDSQEGSIVTLSDLTMNGRLQKSKFFGATFYRIRFEQMDVRDCEFIDCEFLECSFSDVTFGSGTYEECAFAGCYFSADEEIESSICQVTGALFKECVFNHTYMAKLRVYSGKFLDCQFAETCMLDPTIINESSEPAG